MIWKKEVNPNAPIDPQCNCECKDCRALHDNGCNCAEGCECVEYQDEQ